MLASATLWTACAPPVTSETRIHRMGERVTVGSLVYNVFEDQWKAKLGEGDNPRVPRDRFFLVRVSIVNGGTSELPVPPMLLLNDAGQTFSELSDGEGVPNWTGYLRQVKPAETLEGNVVFDVPPRHYRLRVTDENAQKSRDIDLPLNFTSDAQDIPVPSVQ